MKNWGIPLGLGFGVTLALVVGERMSSESMAVVIGVAVGVAASIPTTFLLLVLVRRAMRPVEPPQPVQQFPMQVPWPYTMPPGMMPQQPQLPPPGLYGGGQYEVIGGAQEEGFGWRPGHLS